MRFILFDSLHMQLHVDNIIFKMVFVCREIAFSFQTKGSLPTNVSVGIRASQEVLKGIAGEVWPPDPLLGK